MIRRVELGAPGRATDSRGSARRSIVFTALGLATALLSPATALAGEEPPPSCGEPGDTGMTCTVGVGACLSVGPLACGDDGLYVCKATPGTPRAEVCDGQDNDCNGLIDDGLDANRLCYAGTGACHAMGFFTCTAEGVDFCDAHPGTPEPEICGDAHDSDCDGNASNGCGCGDDADCGGAGSGLICSTTHACVPGCHAADGCPSGLMCDAPVGASGSCVACLADIDCGGFSSGKICEAAACVSGCRLDGSSGCPTGLVCSTSPSGFGSCELLVTGGSSSSSSSGGSGVAPSPGSAVSSADDHNLIGSSSSSSSGDPDVVDMNVVEPTPDLASGATGFHCAVLPAQQRSGAGWIFGVALAALAGLRRRRVA